MGFFKRLSQGIEAAYSNQGPSEEALASLSPEQRAAYDANMARVAEAQAQAVANLRQAQGLQQAQIDARPLRGPAGEHLYGGPPPATYPGSDPNEMFEMNAAELTEWSLQQSKAQFQDLIKNPLGRRKAPVPTQPDGTPAPPDLRPAAEIGASERAARAAARAPYLADERWPVTVSRIATRGKTQVEELAAWLGSSGLAGRPDLVYGVSRVADRTSPGRGGSEQRRVVEWDVIHAATEALPPAPTPIAMWFDGAERWVARAVGEASLLDEDLAGAYLTGAGIPPEQTLGIARRLSFTSFSSGSEDSADTMWARVDGVLAFHPASVGVGVHDQMAAARPLLLAEGPPAGTYVEVLNWEPVRQVVQPQIHKAPIVPSPFPYLPSTPLELLESYLTVVGVRPSDCCSAQATRDRSGSLVGRTDAGGLFSIETNTGPAQPGADGKARRRLAGTDLVVVAYRDRPEHQAGRARWDAYQRDVLQADLRKGTGARRPVEPVPNSDLPRGLRGVLRVADAISTVTDGFDATPDDPPHRYCWPPVPTP
ncbi:hypothetical protein KSP35_22430 [Aquihabitans sp. G128]|uniref:hypothetical protein n=1 Tax=Aquihabitans sp. G128 TaxID=2849779 RepID=UPI001C23FDAF|nr:hypothetical protein [Aquihabitans sp. G128]QXC61034.1 hypothetical protein KSP35_22430 [Aquihabitans sp. G128]